MSVAAPAETRAPVLRGGTLGLLAALLFGLSAPISKRLLAGVGPVLLAGLLYLGAALALTLVSGLRRAAGHPRTEAALRRADVPLLAGIVLLGGVLGPVLMLAGLSRLHAVTASLLLNLEAVFTIALAVLAFGEHLGRRELVAALLVVLGAVVLGLAPGAAPPDPLGIAAIAGACLSWALDNNLTQRLSLRDPVATVRVKALGAGALSFAVGLALGERLPSWDVAGAALVVGAFSYGASIVLDMYALRLLGAAREAAFFATAPFLGALAAVPIVGESLRSLDFAGGGLMAVGVALLLAEKHGHVHTHEPLEHDHWHVHDEHHRHAHEGPYAEPHSHPHRHEPITHEHPHVPDLHHRHGHE